MGIKHVYYSGSGIGVATFRAILARQIWGEPLAGGADGLRVSSYGSSSARVRPSLEVLFGNAALISGDTYF